MRREEDQEKNILIATQYALPKILFPLLRANLNKSCTTAIDFTFLHKLAEKLGNHGKAIFRKHFLAPESENDPLLVGMLQKLIKLDQYGIFIPIFINELEKVSEGIYANLDMTDHTNEIIEFLEYLITIADREIGSEIELCFFSDVFKVGTILLAKSHIASKRGLIPYLRRLSINLNKGCDSIYIISFPPAMEFLDKLIKAVDGNEKVEIENTYIIRDKSGLLSQNRLKIVYLNRNKIFSSDLFKEKVIANEMKVGSIVQGIIADTSMNEALISINGMDGIIKKGECAWTTYQTCNELLNVGDKKDFLIIDINYEYNNIILSLKFPDDDPWKKLPLPQKDDIISVHILSELGDSFKCLFSDILEVYMPIYEVSWQQLSKNEIDNFINQTFKVKVISIDNEKRKILCSIRQLSKDPWEEIHKNLKPGTRFDGKVFDITDHFVRIKIQGELIGILPKESLANAGYEYANFKENLVIGQGIEVVISKVFIAKKKIRLELARNILVQKK